MKTTKCMNKNMSMIFIISITMVMIADLII